MHVNSDDKIGFSSATSSDMDDDDDVDDEVNNNNSDDSPNKQQVSRELKVLHGVGRFLLPRVGSHVKTLVLECSKGITNGLVSEN